jgi:hypothetical protein
MRQDLQRQRSAVPDRPRCIGERFRRDLALKRRRAHRHGRTDGHSAGHKCHHCLTDSLRRDFHWRCRREPARSSCHAGLGSRVGGLVCLVKDWCCFLDWSGLFALRASYWFKLLALRRVGGSDVSNVKDFKEILAYVSTASIMY